MIRFQPVHMVSMTERTHRHQPVGYRVLENKKGPWLRRFMIDRIWRWLHNCGALEPYWHSEKVYTYNEPKRQAVSEAIMDAMDEVLHSVAYRGARTDDFVVCLGGFEFEEIMRGFVATRPTLIDAGEFYLKDQNGYVAKFHNMPVHVIPHMKGVALIPRILVEKK
jgi:hypothetical protein